MTSSNSFRIAVIPARHQPADGAFVYLEGGPGGAATASAVHVDQLFPQVTGRRDLVLVDQRGTGGSHPLACPQERVATADAGAVAGYLRRCFARLGAGSVTRWGDELYQLVVRWVLNGMIAAEALGVTSKNVDQMKASSKSAEVRRLLGVEGGFGAMMGLSNDWMYNVIKQVGNYGESYERTVGMGSPLKLARGKNELWTKGGLLFTSPFQ